MTKIGIPKEIHPGERRVAATGGLRVVGLLDRFWIPVSDFDVTPVLAIATHRPTLTASPAEVARILEPPVSRFLPDAPVEIVERTIGEVMTHDPVILRSGDPVAVAIHKMAVGGFRHIPIIEDGKPTGVVTARDVFHHLAETLD